jgi:List-Bact-rpt repeat protein
MFGKEGFSWLVKVTPSTRMFIILTCLLMTVLLVTSSSCSPETVGTTLSPENSIPATSENVTVLSEKDLSVKSQKYALTIIVNPGDAGCILNGTAGKYSDGTIITLTARPNDGYLFSNWEGDIKSDSATISIGMDSDKNVIANFKDTISPVLVTGPNVINISEYESEVCWETDEICISKVEYGLTLELGTVITGNLVHSKTHNILINDLDYATEYYYQIESIDKDGNSTTSDIRSFTSAVLSDLLLAELRSSRLDLQGDVLEIYWKLSNNSDTDIKVTKIQFREGGSLRKTIPQLHIERIYDCEMLHPGDDVWGTRYWYTGYPSTLMETWQVQFYYIDGKTGKECMVYAHYKK